MRYEISNAQSFQHGFFILQYLYCPVRNIFHLFLPWLWSRDFGVVVSSTVFVLLGPNWISPFVSDQFSIVDARRERTYGVPFSMRSFEDIKNMSLKLNRHLKLTSWHVCTLIVGPSSWLRGWERREPGSIIGNFGVSSACSNLFSVFGALHFCFLVQDKSVYRKMPFSTH